MRVRVKFTGLFRHYAGEREREYELEEGATVADLLQALGRDLGPRLPEQVWDPREGRFNPLIKAARLGGPPVEEGDRLSDGEELHILSRLAGG